MLEEKQLQKKLTELENPRYTICETCGRRIGKCIKWRHQRQGCKEQGEPYQKSDDHYCKFCGRHFASAVALGGHVIKCTKNPKREECCKKIAEYRKNKKHDKETKEKIKRSILKYLRRKKDIEDELQEEVYLTRIQTKAGILELLFKDDF